MNAQGYQDQMSAGLYQPDRLEMTARQSVFNNQLIAAQQCNAANRLGGMAALSGLGMGAAAGLANIHPGPCEPYKPPVKSASRLRRWWWGRQLAFGEWLIEWSMR